MNDWKKMLAALPSRRDLWHFVREPLAILGFMLVANTAFAQNFYVPSGSMEPTLAIGDAIVASKFSYGYSRYSLPFGMGPSSTTRLLEKMPERGDVVVFRLPIDTSVTYVKRVIGLPGDHVQMNAGHLFINGKEAPLTAAGSSDVEFSDGHFQNVPRFIETLPGGKQHPIFKWQWDGPYDNTAEFIVPAGHLFMMGDNRDDSSDSRVAPEDRGVGFVPMENVVGKAEYVVGSYDFLNAHAVWTWLSQIRLSRFFNGIS